MNSYVFFNILACFAVLIFGVLICILCRQFMKKFTTYSIDEKNQQVIIDREAIKFRDIVNVTVNDDIEDVNCSDRFVVQDTGRMHIDEIVFELKDGSKKSITTRYRSQVYRICKKLMKYKKIGINLDDYKEPFCTLYELIIAIAVIFLFKELVPLHILIPIIVLPWLVVCLCTRI